MTVRHILTPVFERYAESALAVPLQFVSFGSSAWEFWRSAQKALDQGDAVRVYIYGSQRCAPSPVGTIDYAAQLVGMSFGDKSGYDSPAHRPPAALAEGDANNAVYYGVAELRRLAAPVAIPTLLRQGSKFRSRALFDEAFRPRGPMWIDDPCVA